MEVSRRELLAGAAGAGGGAPEPVRDGDCAEKFSFDAAHTRVTTGGWNFPSLLTDWFAHTPLAVRAKNFGVPEPVDRQTIQALSKTKPLVVR